MFLLFTNQFSSIQMSEEYCAAVRKFQVNGGRQTAAYAFKFDKQK